MRVVIQVRIEIPATNHVMESAKEAAGLPLMNDRWLVLRQPSAVSLVANPNIMFPVIRGLTDMLKHFVVQPQDCLR